MSAFLPGTSQGELIIDLIHRLPEPPYLLDTIPRDTIVRIYFFHVMENLMRATCNNNEHPQPYTNLAFHVDLSKYTMLQRKNIATITKQPVKLFITKDNKSYSVCTLVKGLSLLLQWHILEPLEQ